MVGVCGRHVRGSKRSPSNLPIEGPSVYFTVCHGLRAKPKETIRFIKQSYRLEDLRVLDYERLRNLAALVMAAAYFAIATAGTTSTALYVLMAFAGIGWASIVSLPFAIMTEKVDRRRTGFFMGLFNLSVVLPQLFASLVLGRVIQDAPDKSVIFLISGTALALSAFVWLFVHDSGPVNTGARPGGGGHA